VKPKDTKRAFRAKPKVRRLLRAVCVRDWRRSRLKVREKLSGRNGPEGAA
jgi:hypothetical protein